MLDTDFRSQNIRDKKGLLFFSSVVECLIMRLGRETLDIAAETEEKSQIGADDDLGRKRLETETKV